MGNLGEAKNLWMKFNVRGAILTSLFLQVFLIFLAPIRKRCSNRWFLMLIWSAYLCADLVANYALGLITKAHFTATSNSETDAHGDLLAFWAPFLLLHLGGPDTITAFALEDNELWHRHLLNLLFQLGAASYVFVQSFPSSRLIVPTILTFIGGTIKYMERTRALYLASFSKFRDSLLPPAHPGLDHAEFVQSLTETGRSQVEMLRLLDVQSPYKKPVIKSAFVLFTTFKGLLVDLIYSYLERDISSEFFRSITAKEAFQVIEAELNFFYDVLYTKAAIVQRPTEYVFRAISIGSIVSASAGFYVLNKHGFHEYDIRITYTLLLGAIGLEFVALVRLICSDWTIAKNATSESSFFKFLLRFKSESPPFELHIQTARWSKSMFQYSFIDSRLKGKWPKWIVKPLGLIPLEEWIDDLKPRRVEKFNETLGELIFEELKRKSSDAENLTLGDEELKRLGASRGEWALRNTKTRQNCEELLRFVRDVNYGESLLLWHIATEICYNTNESTIHRRKENTDESTDESTNHRPDESADESTNHRRKENTDFQRKENSKVLSNYMLHLMMKQPNMMSAVIGIGLIRFRDTCADAHWLFGKNEPDSKMDACRNLLSFATDERPVDVSNGVSKSVFFDACVLAKELGKFEEDEKWEMVSGVWVELVGYAAIKCQPFMHAQQLSKGGQLVTLVWLLMVHLGLSEHFQIKEWIRIP